MERLRLRTADDVSIEAEIDVPAGAIGAVVLGHPHPLYGGSMRTGAPDALFRRLPAEGVAALRFNFRGVEGSDGIHADGIGEQLDLAAAIDALAAGAAGVPLVVCGWSFGGDVSLCVDHPALTAWCPLAAPLRIVPVGDMKAPDDPRPKHLLVPEHDQYSPPERTTSLVTSWTATTTETIAGTDHFLGGALNRVGDSLLAFLATLP